MKHEMKIETKDTGTCDDHYCTGHHITYVICSCGWLAELKYIPGISSNETVAYLQHLEHRVKELEKD